MWIAYLFVYFLLALVVTLVLGLFVQLRPSVGLRRAMGLVILSGGAALCVVVGEQAREQPWLWIVVGLLVLFLAVSAPMMWKDAARTRSR